ncbi:hypothetical protein ACI78V_11200 [Geodermatophilus sp. SYSU D00742]
MSTSGELRGGSRPALGRLVVVVVGAALAAALLLPHQGPAPAPGGPTPPPADVLAPPPRGSLAADTAFLDGVRRLPWTAPESAVGPGIPDAPLASRRVVFAGDVPGGRWALVAGAHALVPGKPPPGAEDGRRDLAVAWFAGPPGAPPGQMTLHTVPQRAAPGRPSALLDPRTGALVVVTAPGDVVAVSAHPEIAADGSVGRTYRTVPAPEGVAVVALPPTGLPSASAVAYRVLREGALVASTRPDLAEHAAAPAPAPPAVEHWRAAPSAAGERLAREVVAEVLARVGLPRTEVDVALPWVGDVPGPDRTTGLGVVVTVTVPSGAVVVAVEWRLPEASGLTAANPCALAVEPAGVPVDRRVLAASCAVLDGWTAAARPSLVVVAPRVVTTVRAHSSRGSFLVEHPATDGVVVAPFPRGTATVEAVTAGGVSLGRVRLLGRGADLGS